MQLLGWQWQCFRHNAPRNKHIDQVHSGTSNALMLCAPTRAYSMVWHTYAVRPSAEEFGHVHCVSRLLTLSEQLPCVATSPLLVLLLGNKAPNVSGSLSACVCM